MERKHVMQNKTKNTNAITLIALVVTIVVLLILSAISITAIIGTDGIISKAEDAKEKTNIGNYDTVLQTLGVSKKAEKILQGLSTQEYMNNYKEAVEKEPTFDDATVKFKNEEETSFRIVTKEGYVFDVDENGVTYVGKQGEIPKPPTDLQTGNIEFKPDNTSPTKEDVKVTITSNLSNEFTLQYVVKTGESKNVAPEASEWQAYKDPIVMQENGVIYARLINKLDESGATATAPITNIDKLYPKEFNAEITGSTTHSITAQGSTTDQVSVGYEGSKDLTYYFKIETTDNGKIPENAKNWIQSDGTVPGGQPVSYTFDGLEQGKTYKVTMKAEDAAGNETTSTPTEDKKLETVPDLDAGTELQEGNIKFTYSETKPTSSSVTVTIENKTGTNHTLQYATKKKNEIPIETD